MRIISIKDFRKLTDTSGTEQFFRCRKDRLCGPLSECAVNHKISLRITGSDPGPRGSVMISRDAPKGADPKVSERWMVNADSSVEKYKDLTRESTITV